MEFGSSLVEHNKKLKKFFESYGKVKRCAVSAIVRPIIIVTSTAALIILNKRAYSNSFRRNRDGKIYGGKSFIGG